MPRSDFHGAFFHRADLSGASPQTAIRAGGDEANPLPRRAGLEEASAKGTIMIGADHTGAINLTVDQLKSAAVDETTILPSSIRREEQGG